MIGVFSRGMLNNPQLSRLMGQSFCRLGKFGVNGQVQAVAGWGAKPNVQRVAAYAARHNLPLLRMEDGFLRSFGTGADFPQLSLIVDELGIYYDSTRASSLEQLLEISNTLNAHLDDVLRAKSLILKHRLSKYNHAPLLADGVLRANDTKRVLVIDQTAGDMSVSLGAASGQTFSDMLACAYAEHPDATIYVKTHPEVSQGHKGGYLTTVQSDARTVVLRDAINPLSLIEQMDHVYVVTSTMGFEALLAGKPVSVFGLPWYAGWGVTDDRQVCPRRTRRRSVDELFSAAYMQYTRYLDPVTHESGSIFDVIDWLVLQRNMADRYAGRMICVGFRRWKAANLKPLLSLDRKKVLFVADAAAAAALSPSGKDCLIFWGRQPPEGLRALSDCAGVRLLRMEDGFVRSVGLGSDLIAPLSLVLDESGIYFDPTQTSDLEAILAKTEFTEAECVRAAALRAYIVKHGVTKYNVEPRKKADWPNAGREVVFVPGQVEDDASIRYGCTDINTNLGLLQAARQRHPDAFIVYKPHPDVMSGNRIGRVALDAASAVADYVETALSVVSCIDACDVVHTMTSLTGFDALLRHKEVVVYGQPFYAGWGLTTDILTNGAALARRQRKLTLDQLVAGTLCRYPLYFDPFLKGYAQCESVVQRIVSHRDQLEKNNQLQTLNLGFWRRQRRKLVILVRAYLLEHLKKV